MERTVLVSDARSPLGREIARMLAARGLRVAAAVAEEGGGEAAGATGPGLFIPWHPASPASARTVVLTALNRLGWLDEAVVLGLPPEDPSPAHELSSAALVRAMDRCLVGPALLVREILAHFLRQASGVLSLVLHSARREEDRAPPIERATREGFRGFASAVLDGYAEKTIAINAFHGLGSSAEELAAFVDHTLEERARKLSGKWFTCRPRGR